MKSSVRTDSLSSELVTKFAKTVKSPVQVPFTLLTRFREGEFEIIDKMGFKLVDVLHGEQEYALLAKIDPNSPAKYTTVLADSKEKMGSSGKMIFLNLKTDVIQHGKVVAECRSTMIVRRGAAT